MKNLSKLKIWNKNKNLGKISAKFENYYGMYLKLEIFENCKKTRKSWKTKNVLS